MSKSSRMVRIAAVLTAGAVAVGTLWQLGAMLWRQLYDVDAHAPDYWQVLTSGPLYWGQTVILVEVVCLLVFLHDRMTRAAKVTFGLTLSVVVLGFGLILIWPTFWIYSEEYQNTKSGQRAVIPVRINRFSGERQEDFDGEWQDGPAESGARNSILSHLVFCVFVVVDICRLMFQEEI